jgi:hypothetical protein
VSIDKETTANDAIRDALKAIQRAREPSEPAEYGSLIFGPLANAQVNTQYALDTLLGRTLREHRCVNRDPKIGFATGRAIRLDEGRAHSDI